jgi:hypothetical protein
MVSCPHCGQRAYAGYVAEAAYLTDVRQQQELRLTWLINQVRAGAPAPSAGEAQVAHAWAPPSSAPPTAAPASGAPILLVLGVGLLVIAALVFVAVVWHGLGVGGQAGVLTALTALAAFLAIHFRVRLPATAEALAAAALALLAIDLIAAPALGLFPHRLIDAGSWYLPLALTVVAGAGVFGAATFRLQAWAVGGWFAVVPAAAFLGNAIAHLATRPVTASGYGVLAVVVVGIALVAGGGALTASGPLTRLTHGGPWPTLAGALLLIGSACSAPIAVLGHGARTSWLVLGVATTALLAGSARASGADRFWSGSSVGVGGITVALALLPHLTSALGYAAVAAVLGAASVGVGHLLRQANLGRIAAGGIWAGWIGGRLLQVADHHNPSAYHQVVLLGAVAGLALLADAVLGRQPALAWIAAGSGTLAVGAASLGAHVHVAEWFTLPAAAALLVAGVIWRQQRPQASSVEWCGPSAVVAGIPSAFLCWAAPWVAGSELAVREHLVRLGCVLVLGGAAAVLGARRLWAGLLWPAAVTLVVAGGAQLWGSTHVLPRWLVLAVVGVALVAAGARLEWLRDRRTSFQRWTDRLA